MRSNLSTAPPASALFNPLPHVSASRARRMCLCAGGALNARRARWTFGVRVRSAWATHACTRSACAVRSLCRGLASELLHMGLWRRTGPMGRFWRSVLLCRARSLHVASACAGMPDARRRPLAAPLSGSALAMSSRRRVHPDMCEGAQHAYLHGSRFCFEWARLLRNLKNDP